VKLILLLHAGPPGNQLHRVAEALGLAAHTDLGVVHGAGASGRYEGSRAFPGDEHAMFAVVDDARADGLAVDVARVRDALPAGERLHAFILPVERML
jgi:hypothetical protein